MRSHSIAILLLAFSMSFFSCNTSYHPSAIQYQDYRITNKQTTDSKMNALVKPYADSVHIKMNLVVAEAGMELEKKQPEGTLGNVLADAVLFRSREIYKMSVDAAFYNAGGIRLSSIPAGPITLGKIFELCPFDNRVVLLTLNGEQFQQFLNLIASRGGWPCSGIKFKIKNKEAVDVQINQVVLDPVKTYTIALNDYLANGGDDCSMLKTLERKDNGYLLRDAIVDYFSSFRQNGKKVASTIQNRIINVQ